jgi:hypothetical protein
LIGLQLVDASSIRLAERAATAKNRPVFRSTCTFGAVMTVLMTTKERRRRQLNNAIKSWPASGK